MRRNETGTAPSGSRLRMEAGVKSHPSTSNPSPSLVAYMILILCTLLVATMAFVLLRTEPELLDPLLPSTGSSLMEF